MDSENKTLSELLCGMCNKNQFKYRCPKCQFKSCSLTCCKQHKEDFNCDGVKLPFVPIKKFSEYDDDKSINDQKFLHSLSKSILKDHDHSLKRKNSNDDMGSDNNKNGIRKCKEQRIDNNKNDNENIDNQCGEEEIKSNNPLNNFEQQLYSNCHKKRVWLQYDESKNFEGSRYESYSDVVNWSIKMEFVKEFNDDGSMKVEDIVVKEEIVDKDLDVNKEEHDKEEERAVEMSSNDVNKNQEVISQVPYSEEEVSIDVIVINESEENPYEKTLISPEEGECMDTDDEGPIEISSKIIPPEEDKDKTELSKGSTSTIFYEDIKPYVPTEKGRFTYIARNIVETIKVSTLVKQFIKPKPFGVVVSKGNLDSEVMPHFINAGMDNIIVYMKVPIEGKERYYVLDMNKSILDNLRNRYILNIPTFVVTLNTEGSKIKTLSEMESLELHEYYKEKRNKSNFGGGRPYIKQHNNQNRNNRKGNFNRNSNNRGGFNNNKRGRN
uniref:HIT-type domain-containing protein n=1 Tax=Parastrongyloides trichosuri TaxID=131310 RepID=A0A0N4ZLU0_PARTI